MKNKPRIRFKGFTEDWEQRKLESLGKIITGNTPSTLKKEYWSTNSEGVVWITPTDINSVKTDWSERLLTEEGASQARIVPANSILVTCIASIGKNTINTVEAAFNQQINALVPHLANSYFILTMLNNMESAFKRVAGTSATSIINKKEFGQLSALLPRVEEQNKIGEIFELIDKSITLHQRKLEKLKLAKKALLQKLFPKNGSQFPEIRFKGFTDAWEQREFSDIFAEIKSGLSRMLSNDDIGLPVVRANNINDGQLNLVDDIKYWYKNDPQGANTNNYLIEQGDILINFINSEAKMGTAAYVTRKPERDTIYTTNILRCKVNDEYNPYFIYSLTFLNSYKNYIASITKPAVNQASFTTVDFKKYSTKIPIVKEQKQIADLIETFNKLITLHQCKLDKLQDVKKGLIQKMFV